MPCEEEKIVLMFFWAVGLLSLGSLLTFYSGYKYGPHMLSRRTRKFRDGKDRYRAKHLVVKMRLKGLL